MKSKYNYSFLLIMTLAASFGGFLFGYDTAVVSGAIGFLKNHFQLNADLTGWAASSLLVGCMLGAGGAGTLGDRFGRKWTLFACAVIFALSSVVTAMADSIDFFAWSRFGGGLAIGAASMLSPLYIAEIAPKQIRGTLVALYQMAIVVGIMGVFFVNLQIQRMGDESWNIATGWRWMFASMVIPSSIFGLLMLLACESPRWLLKMGRGKEARAILEKVGDAGHVESEMKEIQEALQEEEGRWSELFTTGYSRALVIGTALAVFSQLSGINAIIYFAPEIFRTAGATRDSAFMQTVVIGVVNFLFTFVALWFIDRAGRKPLLIIGTLVQALSLTLVGIMFEFSISGAPLLICIVAFTGAFATASGPITWIVNSEIFPTKLRGRAMSISILALWLADFLVTQTFPALREGIGPAKTFWVYGFFSLLSGIFVIFMVPETKGRTLEEIERSWLHPKP